MNVSKIYGKSCQEIAFILPRHVKMLVLAVIIIYGVGCLSKKRQKSSMNYNYVQTKFYDIYIK